MINFKEKYRYHPDSEDTHVLCKLLEEKLPNAQFNHDYITDFDGSLLMQIKAWDESESRYYAHTLRDPQGPEDIADQFYQRLKPRNPEPTIWLPPGI